MPTTDDDGGAGRIVVDLTKEWTPILAAVSVGFRLRLARCPALRGVERGLQLHVWPQSGLDKYFEVWRVRSWTGQMHTVTPLSQLAIQLRQTSASYAEHPD